MSAGGSLWIFVSLRIGGVGAVVLPFGDSLRTVLRLDPWTAVGFIASTAPITHSQTKVRRTEGNATNGCWPENVPLVPVCLISRPIAKKSPLNKPFCFPCQTKNSRLGVRFRVLGKDLRLNRWNLTKPLKETASWQQFQKETEPPRKRSKPDGEVDMWS